MPDPQTIPVGIMASGRGSNFEALMRKQEAGYFSRARIICLVSDKPTARALEVARQFGISAHAIVPKQFPDKAAYEAEVIRVFESHWIQWVALAGYMRLVGPSLLARYENRILNIHPSLLPAFPGLDAQHQAFEHGVRVSGCTVHLVDSGLDSGPIIAQRPVPVLPADTADTLSARILEQEHELYAESLKMVTENPWQVQGRRLVFSPRP